jgi:hypothetical protein
MRLTGLGTLRRAAGEVAAMFGRAPRLGRRIAYVWRMKRSRASDYARWSNVENLETWWTPRTAKLAALIPDGSAVIEFGAGRRQLERFLPAGTRYVASDLVDRGPNTLICDLNQRPLPRVVDLHVDTAVFSGVLEYIVDVPAVVHWLAPVITTIVASYAYVPDTAGTIDGTRHRLERLENGYMNHYSRDQIAAVFEAAGYVCAQTDAWESQALFRFQRRPA